MKIEIFEPTMCCSSGICGPSVDKSLVKISEDIEILKNDFKGSELVRVPMYNKEIRGIDMLTKIGNSIF